MSVKDRVPDPSFSAAWRDPALLGASPEFKNRETWRNWEVVGKALFGETLTSEERSTFQQFTQRPAPPDEADEALIVAGRRAGKSKFASLVATYLATIPSWKEYLSAGEVGVVSLFAPNQRSAIAVLLRYIRALVRGSLALRKELTRETADTLEFGRLRTSISVWPSTYRANRGGTLIAARC